MEQHISDGNPSEPVPTGAHQFADWLSVAEAVLYCEHRGLSRTPKTVRKWAARSVQNPEHGDFNTRREDTENGSRYMIERASLHRKIDQELEFEARKGEEPVHTGAHPSAPVQVDDTVKKEEKAEAHPSEPVPTGAHREGQGALVTSLERELDHAKSEINFLRDELRHRRNTDKALADVIEAFRLNAESQRIQLGTGDPNARAGVPSNPDPIPTEEANEYQAGGV